MGTWLGSNLYVEATIDSLERVVDRVFINRGFRLVRRERKLQPENLLSFFPGGEGGRPYYTVLWTPAGGDWLLVLGLDRGDRTPPAVVFPTDIAVSSGRRALDYGFVNDYWWCRYYIDGQLADELYGASNTMDSDDEDEAHYDPWSRLVYGDPYDPYWVASRREANRPRQPSLSRSGVQLGLAVKPKFEPLRTGALETSDIVRPHYHGQVEQLLRGKATPDVLSVLEPAINLRYASTLSLDFIYGQRRGLKPDEALLSAFRLGLSGATYFHPHLTLLEDER